MSHYYEDGPSETDQQQQPAARPSRYRTVRKKQSLPTPTSTTQDASDNHGLPSAPANSISRSMSRYRRTSMNPRIAAAGAATTTIPNDSPDAPPPVPQLPRSLKTTTSMPKEQDSPISPDSPPQPQLRHIDLVPLNTIRTNLANAAHDSNQDRSPPSGGRDAHPPVSSASEKSDEMARASQERAQRVAEKERQRLLAEQKKKDLERLEEELANSQRNAEQADQDIKSALKEKLSLLSKIQKSSGSNKDDAPPMSAPPIPTSKANSRPPDLEPPRRANTHVEPIGKGVSPQIDAPKRIQAHVEPGGSRITPMTDAPKKNAAFIEPGGKGIVPQTDAPNSAINSGDRNVTVRCRHHTFNLTISPDVTAADMLPLTSRLMPYDFVMRPDAWHVIEKYVTLGLERRLRHYEHIRDVMNSWDRDSQNQLIVTSSDPEQNHDDLNIESVPTTTEGPPGCSMYMYHSNKPGKWTMRWISILENGQILSMKSPNAKIKDKDTVSLCRLSDYDVYTPNEAQMRRQLKPPKRFCFGVKSQQKTNIFLNTDNYVQYFCTEDPRIAREFSEKIQTWRSWYLVDRRGMERKQMEAAAKTDAKVTTTVPTNMSSSNGHRMRVSVNETFGSLLEMTGFDKRASQYGQESEIPRADEATSSGRRVLKKSHRRHSSSFHHFHQRKESADGFVDGGLLETEYNERKKAILEEKRRSGASLVGQNEGQQMGSPSSPQRHQETQQQPEVSWFPSALEHSAKRRDEPPPVAAVRPKTSDPNDDVPLAQIATANTSRRPTKKKSLGTARPSTSKQSSSAQRERHHHHHHATPHSHTHHATTTTTTHPPNDMVVPRHPNQPKPLLDLSPEHQEPPQWKKGRGVKPDGDGHLVNFIETTAATNPESAVVASAEISGATPGSLLSSSKRPVSQHAGVAAASSRSRSRSFSGAGGGSRGDVRGGGIGSNAPPVPALPSQHREHRGHGEHHRTGAGHGEHNHRGGERHRERRREQEREYREREAAYNAVPGRTGVLKVV